MKRPFAVIGFTVFFTIAFLFDKETGVTAAALAAFTVALVVALFSKKIRENKILPLCSMSGAVACVLLIVTNTFILEPTLSYAGGEYLLKAQITDEVSVRYGKYYFDAKSVSIDGEKVETDLRLVFSAAPDIKPYDFVEGNFAFYQPGSGNEDYLNANRSKGLFLGAYPVSDDYEITEIPDGEKPFAFKMINVRNKIKRAVYDVFPDENGALAVGMLLGDKSEITDETYDSFRSAGIAHLICVSGLHLTLWTSLVFAVLRSIGVKEKLACILTAVGTVFFMALMGFSYSVLRAGIMMLVYLASRFALRDPDPINSLGFSVAVIALGSPYAPATVSLQLSVLATLGILCANEFLLPEAQKFYDKIAGKGFRTVIKSVANAIILTLSATMFIQPVMLSLSGGFNFASIISNLIVTPFACSAMAVSALGAAAGVFLPLQFNALGIAGKIFLQYIIEVSGFIASKEFFNLPLDESAADAIVYIVFFVVAAMFLLASVYKPKPLAMSVATCAVFFCCVAVFAGLQKNETGIRIIDTGNGVSVLVTHGEETVLVGCGGTSYTGESRVINALERTNGIDCLVLPSPEKSATAYAVEVIKQINPKSVYCDSLPDNASLFVSKNQLHMLDSAYSSGGVDVRFYAVDNDNAVLVETDNISLLICTAKVKDFSAFPQDFKQADLLVCLNSYPADLADYHFDSVVICADNQKGVAAQNELMNQGVNAVATGGCGDVVLKANKGKLRSGRD